MSTLPRPHSAAPVRTSNRGDASSPVASASRLVMLLAVLTLALAGCTKPQKQRHGMEGYNGLIRAQQEALALQEQGAPSVYFRGAVQRPAIPWSENLTLAQGLLDAGYNSPISPRSLRVTRQGRTYTVDVRRLLRGTDNPVLEPGDVVEVVR